MKRYSREEFRQLQHKYLMINDAEMARQVMDYLNAMKQLSDGTYIKLDELVEAVEKMEAFLPSPPESISCSAADPISSLQKAPIMERPEVWARSRIVDD